MATPKTLTEDRELLACRVPRALATEVRELAQRENETQSCVIRQLMKLGLAQVRAQRGEQE